MPTKTDGLIDDCVRHIRDIADFPKKGVTFKREQFDEVLNALTKIKKRITERLTAHHNCNVSARFYK